MFLLLPISTGRVGHGWVDGCRSLREDYTDPYVSSHSVGADLEQWQWNGGVTSNFAAVMMISWLVSGSERCRGE